MTEPDRFDRPGTTPTPRRRRPAFAGPRDEIDLPPLDQLAPTLDPPWSKEDTDTPDRTAAYQHPDGHRIGLRVQSRGLAIQTWITAGPDLPPIPDGTDIEQAEAQAANDARLQPGRTWHAVLTTRASKTLAADLGALVRDDLIPALTRKPKKVRLPGTGIEDDTIAKETEH
ncbi:hypothetical protein [Streptomyces sp. NBC_00588]|uniref:hypothetical protein n=1 Tax=Streptomyces sp. NBC_00588 TaxID=2975784 RepID=UPI002E801E79|nr:hypothetical protein [Streptomyces sp. NBC_00588]WUB38541.1 hypothetical protein OHN38_27920 [Streptomyces sp. NBC_00588]